MTFSFSFVLEKEGIMYEELSLNIEAQKKHVRFSYVDVFELFIMRNYTRLFKSHHSV